MQKIKKEKNKKSSNSITSSIKSKDKYSLSNNKIHNYLKNFNLSSKN